MPMLLHLRLWMMYRSCLGFQQLPGVQEFDIEVIENTINLFLLMGDRVLDIDKVIDNQTSKLGSTSSIIDQFNKSLADYDMFGVNRNADVRYQEYPYGDASWRLMRFAELWSVHRNETGING